MRVHSKIHNKDPVMFSHLNAEFLQILSLRASFEFLKRKSSQPCVLLTHWLYLLIARGPHRLHCCVCVKKKNNN